MTPKIDPTIPSERLEADDLDFFTKLAREVITLATVHARNGIRIRGSRKLMERLAVEFGRFRYRMGHRDSLGRIYNAFLAARKCSNRALGGGTDEA